MVRDAQGQVLLWRSICVPARTCNEAEYQAVIAGLELVIRTYPRARVHCLTDSRVVVEQMSGRSKVLAGSLQPLHARATALARQFGRVSFADIPREINRLADALAWEGLGGKQALVAAGLRIDTASEGGET